MSQDPYKLTIEGIKPAPTTFFGKLKYLGQDLSCRRRSWVQEN